MDTTAVAMTRHAREQTPGAGLFSIDPGLSIWTWVVFGFLFVILRKFAWKPMMESVKKRERMMAQAVEQARTTREELERIAKKQAEILQQAQAEARRIVDEGRNAAESAVQRIREKNDAEVRQTMELAREQLRNEKERALREIRERSVDMIIDASEKLIRESLDDDMHRKIVEKHLEDL